MPYAHHRRLLVLLLFDFCFAPLSSVRCRSNISSWYTSWLRSKDCFTRSCVLDRHRRIEYLDASTFCKMHTLVMYIGMEPHCKYKIFITNDWSLIVTIRHAAADAWLAAFRARKFETALFRVFENLMALNKTLNRTLGVLIWWKAQHTMWCKIIVMTASYRWAWRLREGIQLHYKCWLYGRGGSALHLNMAKER